MSKTSAEVKNRYAAKSYDNVRVIVPKGLKELFREKCEANGTTMNGAINTFIKEYIDKN